jgi:hypothetical protein
MRTPTDCSGSRLSSCTAASLDPTTPGLGTLMSASCSPGAILATNLWFGLIESGPAPTKQLHRRLKGGPRQIDLQLDEAAAGSLPEGTETVTVYMGA